MQRFTWLAGAVSACLLTAAAPAMAWDVSQLGQLTSAFESGLAGSFTYQQYPWQFLTPDQCFTQNFKCAFSNPDGPYGHPVPGAPPLQLSTYLASNEAFVMIMETPPPMLYYGITPYINTRYYGSEPQNPAASGTLQVLESLQDSVNMADIGTTGSSTPGVNSFSQLAVFIMTADQTTYQQLRQQFEALGFPDSAINLLTMPVNDVPLDMGGNHILGGARMSDDPETGVCDFRGEVYGHPGLHVSDAASIPGALGINPALTIGANALRIADELAKGSA